MVLFLSLSPFSLFSPYLLASNILSSFKLPSHHFGPDSSLPLSHPCTHCQHGFEAVFLKSLDSGHGLASAVWVLSDCGWGHSSLCCSLFIGRTTTRGPLPKPTWCNWLLVRPSCPLKCSGDLLLAPRP